jgi:hypothetical protein
MLYLGSCCEPTGFPLLDWSAEPHLSTSSGEPVKGTVLGAKRSRAEAKIYFKGSMLSIWIVLLFISSLPTTLTCLPR